jgi:hypothetical protein
MILRIAFAFTAILLATATAQAQTPFPGVGPLYGSGVIQGNRDYNDWQQTRRDHGLDYDRAIDRPSVYQPYFSETPHMSDPYRSHRSPYDDDND